MYFLAKQQIPHTSNFEPLLDLLGLLGLTVKSDIHAAKNATYTSNKCIQDMLYWLSEVIQNRILNELRESNHFSLMFDETTDCTITEQLAVHGRYINKKTGALSTAYLKVLIHWSKDGRYMYIGILSNFWYSHNTKRYSYDKD